MRIPIEAVDLPRPAEAANQDFESRDIPLRNDPAPGGWNAYEIWRVRIKAVLDSRHASIRPAPRGGRTR